MLSDLFKSNESFIDIMEIQVSANIGDKFLQGLQEVLNVIDLINRSDDKEDVIIFQNNSKLSILGCPNLVYYPQNPKGRITRSNNP